RLRPLKSAARLLLCRLSCSPSRLGGVLLCRTLAGAWLESGAVMPVHLLICFCRYLRWLTFLLDFTGLSKASLMLLEAELMKLSRSRLVCLTSPSPSTSPTMSFHNNYSQDVQWYSELDPYTITKACFSGRSSEDKTHQSTCLRDRGHSQCWVWKCVLPFRLYCTAACNL
uniref:Uncharacterized protein n=1 Tax=Electrophorus electricus TaxID=8005 RepID=A0A4W4GIZ6_ELEEL